MFDSEAVDVLKTWMLSGDHIVHPYPTAQERNDLARKAKITPKQVRNWFVNARKRIWQPLMAKLGKQTGETSIEIRRKILQECLDEKSQDFNFEITTTPKSIVSPQHSTMSSVQWSAPMKPLIPKHMPTQNLRKGLWTREEEEYARRLIDAFTNGLIRVEAGTTLRGYLAYKLRCDPMRISKKFSREARIGKILFETRGHSEEAVDEAEKEIFEHECRFLNSLDRNLGFDHKRARWTPPIKNLEDEKMFDHFLEPIPLPEETPSTPGTPVSMTKHSDSDMDAVVAVFKSIPVSSIDKLIEELKEIDRDHLAALDNDPLGQTPRFDEHAPSISTEGISFW